MKKFYIGMAVFVVLVVSLGVVGFAFARNLPFQESGYLYGHMHDDQGWFSHGMMGCYGDSGHGPGMMGWDEEHGPMHDSMVAELAGALGLSTDEIDSRIDAGETVWEIAESEGLSLVEIQEFMLSSHDEHHAEAVEKGWITPEQVELMEDHMSQMWDGNGEGGYGSQCGGMGR
jgi:hypothetical protein